MNLSEKYKYNRLIKKTNKTLALYNYKQYIYDVIKTKAYD